MIAPRSPLQNKSGVTYPSLPLPSAPLSRGPRQFSKLASPPVWELLLVFLLLA
jgi:hypothetical protein